MAARPCHVSRKRLSAVALAVMLGATGVLVGGVASGQDADPLPSSAPAGDEFDVAAMAAGLDPAERAAVLERLPEGERAGNGVLLDQLASGRIRAGSLVDGQSVDGWVSTEVLSGSYPVTVDDLFPVVDDDGTVVGYLAPGITMIPADELPQDPTDAEVRAAVRSYWQSSQSYDAVVAERSGSGPAN